MRHGASGRRSRNRGGNRRGNQNRSQVFDSNGPDVRIRGTAHQIHEKYVALAKDASGSGDRILEQSYLQHAEHYQRIINSWADDPVRQQQSKTISSDQPSQEKPVSEERAEKAKKAKAKAKEDDLGLPASILGEAVNKDEMEDA